MRHALPRRLGSLAACLLVGLSALAVAPVSVAARQPAARPRPVAGLQRIAGPAPISIDVRHAARGVAPTASGPLGARPAPASASGTARPALRPLDGGPPPPQLATTTGAPAIGEPGVAGLIAGGPLTSLEPSDSSVAVGPDQVVQVANAAIRFTNRQGVPSAPDLGLATFFHAGGRTVSSPRVIYDALHGRWLAVEESWDCISDPDATYGHGYIDLAVSRTTDPTGTWDVYPFSFDDQLPDMPTIGVSKDKVGLTANMYPFISQCTFGGFAGSYVAGIDWSGLTASHGSVVGYATTDSTRFGAQVADQLPAVSTALQFLDQANDGSGDIEYFDADGTAAAGTFTLNGSFDLASYGIAGPSLPLGGLLPQQPGPDPITADIDNRLLDAVWQNNELAATSTYPCHPTGDSADRLCVRVTELNTVNVDAATPPSLTQDFLLNALGRDTYVGGLTLSGDGTLHVVFNQSSGTPGDFASSYDVYQLPTDPHAATSAPALIGAGQATYAGTEWGDYTTIAQDPQVPGAVWQATAFVNAAQRWSTYVNQLQTGGTTYVPITPVRIVDSRDGSGASGLAGKFSAGLARSFAVAGLGGIALDAVAVSGNLTVTNQTKAGYLALTPDPTDTPSSSTLNFPVGDNRANNVTIPLNATGQLAAVYKALPGATADVVFDVTGFFIAGGGQATYVPISPTRVLDTRTTTRLVASSPLVVPVGLPSDAIAVTANLTVVNQTRAGFLAVTPTADPSPATSTLNFPAGDIRANGLAVSLSSGSLAIVYKAAGGATTDVALDITGYFTTKPATGLAFYPLNPSRIMDSRGAPRSLLTGPFKSSTPRSLPVTGEWGVPAGAAAVTGNLTVVGQTSAGFVAATDAALPNPLTSTLNVPLGDIRANGITTPLDGSGASWFVFKGTSASKTTNLVLDLTGYFQ